MPNYKVKVLASMPLNGVKYVSKEINIDGFATGNGRKIKEYNL